MMMVEIRQQLHQYIDAADDKNIEAIYIPIFTGKYAT